MLSKRLKKTLYKKKSSAILFQYYQENTEQVKSLSNVVQEALGNIAQEKI